MHKGQIWVALIGFTTSYQPQELTINGSGGKSNETLVRGNIPYFLPLFSKTPFALAACCLRYSVMK